MFKRLMQQVDRMLGRGVIDEQLYDELEEALLQADTNVQTTQEILGEVRKSIREEKITTAEGIKDRLQKSIADRFRQEAPGLIMADEGDEPTVFLFVGVNGVGKTTTIAKVAALLKRKGFSVI